jgi:hypothetical protein
LNNQFTLLVGYADLLSEAATGNERKLAESLARAAKATRVTVERLSRIVRFAEIDVGGGPMLDLDAATLEDSAPGSTSPLPD